MVFFCFLQALDLVDNDLLADMEPIDLSILGELRLNKIDYICADISDLTGGLVWSIGKGLLGDLGDMDFSAIKNKSRSQGDFQMILNVLNPHRKYHPGGLYYPPLQNKPPKKQFKFYSYFLLNSLKGICIISLYYIFGFIGDF